MRYRNQGMAKAWEKGEIQDEKRMPRIIAQAPATNPFQWDGRPHPKRHQCAKVEVSNNHVTRGRRHHEDYDNRYRFGKKCPASAWGERAWQGCSEEATQARPSGRVLRQAAALSDWHGSMR